MTESVLTDCISLAGAGNRIGIRDLVPAVLLADHQAPDGDCEVTCVARELEGGAVCAQARVRNTGDRPLHIQGIRWRGANGPALCFPPEMEPEVYATENLRTEFTGIGTVEGNRFSYPLTNQTILYGEGEDHLFPGVFVFSRHAAAGLLIAQASQRRLGIRFRFSGRLEHQPVWLFEIEESIDGVPFLTLAPGETLTGEMLYLHLAPTADPQQAVAGYFALLQADGAFARRALNPLPAQRIYCSWNYDFFADIDQEKLLAQLPILKQYFPNVRFVQLDDGYQGCHAPGRRAMIDFCYGDLEHPFDSLRFPDGPKALADRIKAAGLRPAIWLGLWASMGSRMLADHPDWILRDDTGRLVVFKNLYSGTAILDPSVPGVIDYLEQLCRVVFGDWGFEGVKLDFSSFAFNGKRIRYRFPGKTAIERRHELEAMFRRHLPEDGFFGWCVVTGTAQPFLGQADYFRNGVDIGHGDWATAKRIARWAANTNMLLQQRPCLPNLDSIGWSAGFDDVTWQAWLDFAAVCGGALEVSGDLRKLDGARLERLALTLALSDPARVVRCLDLPAGEFACPPALWLSTGDDGQDMLGVFNWRDEDAAINLAQQALYNSGPWRDAWNGQTWNALPAEIRLSARSSKLLRKVAP